MTGTRRQTRASGKRTDERHVPAQAPARRKRGVDASATTIDLLPQDVLLLIFQQLGFPHRFNAAEVCRAWRAASADPLFTRAVTGSINDAIREAQPGDTLCIPSGFFNETILIDRPLKLVGQQLPNLRGQLRRSVTLQSRQHMAVLCNAQACLEAVTIRTLSGSDNRSIVAFGPQCSCICLNDCDLAGSSGLLIPQSKGPDTRLVLKHCSIHSVHHPVPAISINIGCATLVGCTIYRNDMAIEVLQPARLMMSNCDVSYNRCTLELDGTGTVKDCVFWGNEQFLSFGEGDASGSAAGGQQLSAAPAGAVRGIGAASGIVFSGNHVRTNQHEGAIPSEADKLRRQIQQLSRQVYGNYVPDYNNWEILGETDLDSDTSSEEGEQPHLVIDLVSGSDSDGSLSSDSDVDVSDVDLPAHQNILPLGPEYDWSSSSMSETDSDLPGGSSSDSGSSGPDVPPHQHLAWEGGMFETSSDDEDFDPNDVGH